MLTFYSERLVNESYLRTSRDRTSLQELGKLVAYRLDAGVAAETWLAFSFERPPAPLPSSSSDPGQTPPAVPAAVTVPEGLRVQSIPGPGELPQTFETVEAVEARPEWNALPLVRTKPHLPVINRVDAWLAGVGLNLAKGDAILFASADLVNDRWDVRLLTSVEVDAAGQRTHVEWEYGLGSVQPLQPAGGRTGGVRAAQAALRLRPQRPGVGRDEQRLPDRLPEGARIPRRAPTRTSGRRTTRSATPAAAPTSTSTARTRTSCAARGSCSARTRAGSTASCTRWWRARSCRAPSSGSPGR